ncbi:proline-rich receptor-like protein kinase PERK14 isoform X2 [Notolabrus celidotus]|nr:proline-rich receptor-like protein kinase PERK14 isoform X2 [Notolabrus celidotus]
MSGERLPLIGSSGNKTTAKPHLSSPALQRPRQANSRKRSQQQQTSSSSSYPHTGPASILLSDTTMTPWGGLALSESSFTSIPLPPPPRSVPPPPPPAPQPTPSTPYQERENEDVSSSSFNSEAPSPPVVIPQDHAGGVGRGFRPRRRVLPQCRVPRPPRLPPLRPVTNLSFSRSFTFSFFELPLHQSPRHRAERVRNLMVLLRQMHY